MPKGQFTWLEKEIYSSRDFRTSVYILEMHYAIYLPE